VKPLQFELELVEEVSLPPEREAEIVALLTVCFDDYPARAYYKQLPHRRVLASEQGGLVGHAGLDLRVMSLGAEPLRILGLADVCIAPASRGRGAAGAILESCQRVATDARCDFVVLFADDPRLYERHGFVRKPNRCQWLKLHEHRTLGLGHRALPDALMVRPVGSRQWDDGAELDLLGFMF
jgi:GNAT superfamily N-acetyltransferase